MTDQEKFELQQLKDNVATLSAENKELKEEATKKREQDIKVLVQLAIDQKKIGETEKEAYEKLAMQDLESTKKILEAKPVAMATLSGMVQQGGKEPNKVTYEQLMREDHEALQKLSVENPKEFEKLKNDYLNSKK